MIRMIVGRCHVGDSYLSVIRYVLSRLAQGRKTYFAIARGKRRKLLREIIREHKANRQLYNRVMFGR